MMIRRSMRPRSLGSRPRQFLSTAPEQKSGGGVLRAVVPAVLAGGVGAAGYSVYQVRTEKERALEAFPGPVRDLAFQLEAALPDIPVFLPKYSPAKPEEPVKEEQQDSVVKQEAEDPPAEKLDEPDHKHQPTKEEASESHEPTETTEEAEPVKEEEEKKKTEPEETPAEPDLEEEEPTPVPEEIKSIDEDSAPTDSAPKEETVSEPMDVDVAELEPLDVLDEQLRMLEERAQRNRLKSLSKALDDIDAQDKRLKEELRSRFDIDNMSESELRRAIIELYAERKVRPHFEAQRLREIRANIEEDAQQSHEQLMEELRVANESALQMELDKMKAGATLEREKTMAELKKKYDDKLKEDLELQTVSLHESLPGHCLELLEEKKVKIEQELGMDLGEERAKLDAVKEHQAVVDGLKKDVNELIAVYEELATSGQHRREIRQMSAQIVALQLDFESGAPLASHAQKLKSMGGSDEVVASCADLLHRFGGNGVSTVQQLREDFDTAHDACRTALLVPKSLPGASGQLLAALLSPVSRLGISQLLYPAEAKLGQVADHLRFGDVKSAVSVARSLRGPEALPLKDWLKDASKRLAAEDVLTTLKSHGGILNLRAAPTH